MPSIRPFGNARTASQASAEEPRNSMLTEMARHLRQIQFYYMLVCLGLLLAVLLPRDTGLERAATQLDEVIRFQSEAGDEPLWKTAGTSPPEWTGPREPKAAVVFRLPADSSRPANSPNGETSPPSKLNVSFIYENQFVRGYWGLADEEGVRGFRDVETHEEFVYLWQALARDDAYLRVKEYGKRAFFEQHGDRGLDVAQPIAVQLVSDSSEVQRLFREAFSLDGDRQISPTIAEWLSLDEAVEGRTYTRGIRLRQSLGVFGGQGALILPVDVEPARLPILKRLLARSETKYEHLGANDYLLVHEELADWASSGNLDKLGLYGLRSVLETIRVSQGDQFPVFGLAVPYQLLFKYGLAVLVVIQVYFWGHLRIFRLQTSGNEISIWAPWLPLYPNRPSRLLTLGSVTAFPIYVIAQLAVAAGYRPLSLVMAVAGVTTACLILVEFVRVWRAPAASPNEATEPSRKVA